MMKQVYKKKKERVLNRSALVQSTDVSSSLLHLVRLRNIHYTQAENTSTLFIYFFWHFDFFSYIFMVFFNSLTGKK